MSNHRWSLYDIEHKASVLEVNDNVMIVLYSGLLSASVNFTPEIALEIADSLRSLAIDKLDRENERHNQHMRQVAHENTES